MSKFYICIIAFAAYVLLILFSPVINGYIGIKAEDPANIVTDESSCSMPMCESFGGHDAIALDFMFGN